MNEKIKQTLENLLGDYNNLLVEVMTGQKTTLERQVSEKALVNIALLEIKTHIDSEEENIGDLASFE